MPFMALRRSRPQQDTPQASDDQHSPARAAKRLRRAVGKESAMWKSLLAAGLLAASFALTACTEPRVTNTELERATDAELDRHMAVACYDWEAACARTQA